jgi:hypothetical protein
MVAFAAGAGAGRVLSPVVAVGPLPVSAWASCCAAAAGAAISGKSSAAAASFA